jgi:hypothetical protein
MLPGQVTVGVPENRLNRAIADVGEFVYLINSQNQSVNFLKQ